MAFLNSGSANGELERLLYTQTVVPATDYELKLGLLHLINTGAAATGTITFQSNDGLVCTQAVAVGANKEQMIRVPSGKGTPTINFAAAASLAAGVVIT